MAHVSRPPGEGADSAARGAPDGPSSDALAGSLLGRFRIARALGRSDTSRVYAATEAESGIPVAIKLVRARRRPDGALESGEQVLVRLRREAEVLRQLEGPGLPRFREISEQPPYLVLDRIDGVNLEQALSAGMQAFTGRDIATICAGLAEVLAGIHARGLLHTDIKPANVVLSRNGAPYLVDFGSARRLVAPEAVDDWSLTPGYAPPEFHRADSAVGPWSDVYSLGAVAYRMIAGRPPVPAEARLRGAAMPSAVAIAADSIPDELAAAVDWALELDPAARPFSAEEWRQSLCRILDGRSEDGGTVRVRRRTQSGLHAGGLSGTAAASATRRRWRAWGLAAGIAALVLASAALLGRDLHALYQNRVKQEWIVDANGQGDEATISAALARAQDGATIRIRPGTYREVLAITRPVDLVGVTENGQQPLIAATSGACITVTAPVVRIARLVVRGPDAPGGGDAACVDVAAGVTLIEGVAIAGAPASGVRVRNGAELRLIDSRVTGSGGAGVVVTGGARAILSGGEIRDSGRSAIIVRGGADLRVIDTHVGGAREAGLLLAEGAVAHVENATIGDTGTSAVEITSGARGRIAGSTIAGAGQAGIFVLDAGKVDIERTEVAKNGLSGLIVAASGEVAVEQGTFEENREHGVLVLEQASGVIANSRMIGNAGHGIAVERGAVVEFVNNVTERNREPQTFDTRRPDGAPADRRRGGAS